MGDHFDLFVSSSDPHVDESQSNPNNLLATMSSKSDESSLSSESSSNGSALSGREQMSSWHSQLYGLPNNSALLFSPSSSSDDFGHDVKMEDLDEDDIVWYDDDVDTPSDSEIYIKSKKWTTAWSSLCDEESKFQPDNGPKCITSSNSTSGKPNGIDDIVDELSSLFDEDDEELKSIVHNINVKNNHIRSELPNFNAQSKAYLEAIGVKSDIKPDIIKQWGNAKDFKNESSPSSSDISLIQLSSDEDEDKIVPIRILPPTSSQESKQEIKNILAKRKERQNNKRKVESPETIPKKSRAQPRKRARREINPIFANSDLSASTREAKRAEKQKRARLAEKEKIHDEEVKALYKDRIILDFDIETKEVLCEVEPKFVKHLKPHQVEGVKFLFNSTVESIERLEMTDVSEKSHSYGGILAHSMGLGKTMQVIVFIQSVLSNQRLNSKIKTILLIVPLNVIKNWQSEFDKWFRICGLRRKFLLHELHSCTPNSIVRANRLQLWRENGGVLLITPKLFSQLIIYDDKQSNDVKETIEKCLLSPGPDIVIIDEGHCLKNDKTDLNITISLVETLRRVILTGTPLQNNLNEYYTMVSFVKPGILGSKEEFNNQFGNPINNGQFQDSTDSDVKLMKKRTFILSKFLENCTIHRKSYSILEDELPPRLEIVLECRMTEVQKKLYQYYLDHYVFGEEFGEFAFKKMLFLNFHILGYIQNHAALLIEYFEETRKRIAAGKKPKLELDDEEVAVKGKKKSDLESVSRIIATWSQEHLPKFKDVFELTFGSKFELLFSILAECAKIGDKVLVFSQSLLTLDFIEKFLKKNNETYKVTNSWIDRWEKGKDYLRIDGSVNSDDRDQIIGKINDTQNKRARLLLISTKAGGVGINLVGANRAVIFDASWNPANDLQAIYRIYRFGQKKNVYIYRFASWGSMEGKIYKRQVQKQSVALRVIDEYQVQRHFKDKMLRELYYLEEDEMDENRDPPAPPKEDQILWTVLGKSRNLVASLHHHNSLLENLPSENLSKEEQNEVWNDYLRAVDAGVPLPNGTLPPPPPPPIPQLLPVETNGAVPYPPMEPFTASFYGTYSNSNYFNNRDANFNMDNSNLISTNASYNFQSTSATPGYFGNDYANDLNESVNFAPSSNYPFTDHQPVNNSIENIDQIFQSNGDIQIQNVIDNADFDTDVDDIDDAINSVNEHSQWNFQQIQQQQINSDMFNSPDKIKLAIIEKRTEADKLLSTYLQRQQEFKQFKHLVDADNVVRMSEHLEKMMNDYNQKRHEYETLEQFYNTVQFSS